MRKWWMGVVILLAFGIGFAASTQVDLLTQVKAACGTGVFVYIVPQTNGPGTGCDALLVDNATTLTYAGNAIAVAGGGSISEIQQQPGVYASLPTCNSGAKGTFAAITDSTTQTWGATVAGSSTNYALVTCDGTNWTVVGK